MDDSTRKALETNLERQNMIASPEDPDRLKKLNKKILFAQGKEKKSNDYSVNQKNMS